MENLESLEKKYQELGKEIEILKNKNKYDFSKFVGRFRNQLCIFWQRMLKSLGDWDIMYDDYFKRWYKEDLHYEETTISKLKKWDVFILKKDADSGDINVKDFNIYMWKDEDWCYISQCLGGFGEIEIIKNHIDLKNPIVIKILNK